MVRGCYESKKQVYHSPHEFRRIYSGRLSPSPRQDQRRWEPRGTKGAVPLLLLLLMKAIPLVPLDSRLPRCPDKVWTTPLPPSSSPSPLPRRRLGNGEGGEPENKKSRYRLHLKQARRIILLLMLSGNAKVVAFVPLDSRHPSRPAFGGNDWGAENDSGRGRHCPACSGQSSKKEYCFQPVIVRLVPGGSRNLFSPVNPF